MQYAIEFQTLEGNYGEWSRKEIKGPFQSRECAEEKLKELGFSYQEGSLLGAVSHVWLRVKSCDRGNVFHDNMEYFITKADIYELKDC